MYLKSEELVTCLVLRVVGLVLAGDLKVSRKKKPVLIYLEMSSCSVVLRLRTNKPTRTFL